MKEATSEQVEIKNLKRIISNFLYCVETDWAVLDAVIIEARDVITIDAEKPEAETIRRFIAYGTTEEV